jgi:hypothetical protein
MQTTGDNLHSFVNHGKIKSEIIQKYKPWISSFGD